MKSPITTLNTIDRLRDKAARLRIHSIRATTEAGSGHPTSCASAADIVAALFFEVMRFDAANPDAESNDQFVLSKGHAAPLLYAALAEAGVLPVAELDTLRTFQSRLEGHPTPRVPFVDVSTGSLGQGLSAGVGMALSAKVLNPTSRRIFVLLGDGECMEGAVWEAAAIASHYRLSNLCATVDVNGLGQSEPTMLRKDIETHRRRWEAFGWKAIVVDGHDLQALLDAYREAGESESPSVILAATSKGKGIAFAADRPGFHGKALSDEESVEAISALTDELRADNEIEDPPGRATPTTAISAARKPDRVEEPLRLLPLNAPGGKPVATRQAFGDALTELGKLDSTVVVLDGDVQNSTGTQGFANEFPKRFFQMYIAEQNMVGAAMGLAACGWTPFAVTFACFLTRAADFVRMAAISNSNVKFVGSHAGVSIGEDGPSQMGLEDLAMFCVQPNCVVLYPSDAVSTWRATELIARHQGPAYLRTTRPATPILYEPAESFQLGQCKVLRQGPTDAVTLIAAGITVFEALNAFDILARKGINATVIDLFSVQPVDAATLASCAKKSHGHVLTIEDHYLHGGIGDVVSRALAPHGIVVERLAVDAIPRSGEPVQLLEHYSLSAAQIAEHVERMLARNQT